MESYSSNDEKYHAPFIYKKSLYDNKISNLGSNGSTTTNAFALNAKTGQYRNWKLLISIVYRVRSFDLTILFIWINKLDII